MLDPSIAFRVESTGLNKAPTKPMTYTHQNMSGHSSLATILLSLSIAASLSAQGTASGTLTLNGKTFQLKYAAAIQVPNSDKTKTATRIVLADKPIPLDVMDDLSQIWDLKTQDVHGLQLDIDAGKSSVNAFVISNTLEGSVSLSRTLDPAAFSVFTSKRVQGTLQNDGEIGSNKYSYDVKFATDVAPAPAEPTPADAAAAAQMASTKSYLALVKAIQTGDKQAIIAMSPPDRRASVDTPDFPKMLKMVQAMQAQDIRVLKATETGNTATLIASGTQDGKPQRGKITLTKTDGHWVMDSESWGAK
jgi:hypothetical protein